MRARGVLLVAALVAAVLAPVSRAAARPTAVAAMTFIVGYESASIDVTVPKGASLIASAPAGRIVRGFADVLAGTAEWAAVGIFARGGPSYDGKPFNAVQVHLRKPDHCPSDVSLTVPAPPPCQKVVEHTFVNGPAPVAGASGTLRYALAAGTYRIVVSGPPRAFVHVLLQFGGVKGVRGLATTKRVAAAFERTRISDITVAQASGSFSHRFTGKGLGVIGLWHTAAGDEPGEFTYAECVTPGAAGLLNPDDCVPLGLSGQTPPDAVGRKPVYFAGSAGGFTLESWGRGRSRRRCLRRARTRTRSASRAAVAARPWARSRGGSRYRSPTDCAGCGV